MVTFKNNFLTAVNNNRVRETVKALEGHFFIFAAKLACLLHAKKKLLITKRPSLTARMEKFFVSEEKSFKGLATG